MYTHIHTYVCAWRLGEPWAFAFVPVENLLHCGESFRGSRDNSSHRIRTEYYSGKLRFLLMSTAPKQPQ